MKFLKYIPVIVLALSFYFIACTPHDHAHTDDIPEEIGEEDESPDQLHLTEEQMGNIEVQLEKITSRSLKSIVKINGRVELPPNGTAVVSSQLEGKIMKMNVIPGQKVKKGQTIFTVRNIDLIQWKEEYQKGKAEVNYLEKELNRQKVLNQESISSDKELQLIESQLNKERIALNALSQKMEAVNVSPDESGPDFKVNAPQSGVVQHVNVHLGSFITPTTELVEIIDDKHLRVHLFAFGKDIRKLSDGQKINFFVQSRPKHIREAKIVWINNVVNEENNSYEVHADIIGDLAGFSPGEFVEARVINDEQQVLSLPLSAITYDKGLAYIFISEGMVEHGHGPDEEADHEHEFQFRKVLIQTGVSDLGYVEIKPIDPIPDQAEVVVNGAFFLMAQTKMDGGSGHSHEH